MEARIVWKNFLKICKKHATKMKTLRKMPPLKNEENTFSRKQKFVIFAKKILVNTNYKIR